MNFLVIGDSWGFSLAYPNKDFKWLEYNLISKGNNVYNRSVWGNTNISALSDAKFFLEQTKQHIQIDAIIWYYTCLARDSSRYPHDNKITEQSDVTYNYVMNFLSDKVYDQVSNIRESFPNLKWCIIGGHAAIYQSDKYQWADFIIDDWRSELLGEKVETSHSLGELEWLQKNLDKFGVDVIEEELKKHDIIYKKCDAARHVFYDSIHPDVEQSYLLSERIANFFNCNRN